MADSGSSTPNPRFTSTTQTAEDVLKEQTVGLVHLSDFRKRRAEALEQDGGGSGASTPESRELTPKPGFKKRKKGVKRGALSFGDDEEAEDVQGGSVSTVVLRDVSRSATPAGQEASSAPATDSESGLAIVKNRLKPNSSVAFQAKAQTKASLAKEASLKESLRKQYLQLQEAVKATEFVLPFVFFEGKDIAGGKVRLKKGDFIWLFLERARKVGAELAEEGKGPGGAGGRRREWARISVDDLMIVRGEMIIPHHTDFHHFIANKTVGYHGPLFPYASEPTPTTPAKLLPSADPISDAEPGTGLMTAEQLRAPPAILDSDLEGFADDPALTKVIDRRWYEKNKHIYPMSIWDEYDAARDYSRGGRKDKEGNAFFYSSR